MKIPEQIDKLVNAIKEEGGKAYLVGGGVIDSLQGRAIKDWDIEVFYMSYDQLLQVATKVAGKADLIGQKFGVVKVKPDGIDVELSIPRKDNKSGPGHKDFNIELIPDLSVTEAARRRDFTINAIYYDFETGTHIDPFDGISDLKLGKLHPVDKETFVEDPLRAFRAVQIVARKSRTWTYGLMDAIQKMQPELEHLSGDAIFGEMNKLLMLADKPSIGLYFLNHKLKLIYGALIDMFPELKALIGCEQREKFHPEGDVWSHTKLVVNEAAKYRDELPEEWQLAFMWGMLLHDVGKPSTTKMGKKGYLTSYSHDKVGGPIARTFMERLTNNHELIDKVCSIVELHMRPRLFKDGTKLAAWKRLQNRCPLNILAYVSIADGDGRGTKEKLGKTDPVFIECMNKYTEFGCQPGKIPPVLMGRHLIEAGYKPGVKFGKMLEAAYKYQISSDCEDIKTLLKVAANTIM